MPTLSLGGKVIATQTGSAEPEIPSTVSVKAPVSGAIIQQAQVINEKNYHRDGGSAIWRTGNKSQWAATGFLVTLPNALKTNSKLMVIVNANIGEDGGSHWAQPVITTIYQNGVNVAGTQITGLNSSYGFSSSGSMGSAGGTVYNEYFRGNHHYTLIFTPTGSGTAHRTVELYWKSAASNSSSYGVYLNAIGSPGATYQYGSSMITLLEIAA